MATKKPAKAAKKADKAAKKTTKAAKKPIELKLPSGFTAEHVKKAITGDFVKKLSGAFAAGADEVAVTTKREGPTPPTE
jgi:hypothetical protein